MGNFHKRAGRAAVAVACLLVLAGSAVGQQNGQADSANGLAYPEAPATPCPCLGSAAPCRETGNSSPPDLALPPDCWPAPCQGIGHDQFDPVKTQCPDKDDYFIIPPRSGLYFLAEGAAIRRNPGNVNFAAVGTLLTGGTTVVPTDIALSTANFTYDFGAAGHALIGHTINDCLQIEGEYLGVATTDNAAAVRDANNNPYGGHGNLFSPFGNFGSAPILGLDFNNLAQISYKSSLQSAELNVRRQLPMPPEKLTASILFGVRYIGLPEEFDYFTVSDVDSAGGTGGATNAINVKTDNQMVGPQVGALFEFYAENRWWVNFGMKAAVLNDWAKQATDYQNVNNGVTTDYSSSRRENHTAFAGQLDLTFVYRWSPNFSTRLGYEALWLENVALAANNLNTDIDIIKSGPAQLNHTSGTVYHGPYAGIALGW